MRSRSRWIERRELFAEGIASGDPGPDSVLLWTRASAGGSKEAVALTVEVAEDPDFEHVVATAPTVALLAADHTCRVLVGGLRPAHAYWYRFMDENGHGSRIGRTRTAPAADAKLTRSSTLFQERKLIMANRHSTHSREAACRNIPPLCIRPCSYRYCSAHRNRYGS